MGSNKSARWYPESELNKYKSGLNSEIVSMESLGSNKTIQLYQGIPLESRINDYRGSLFYFLLASFKTANQTKTNKYPSGELRPILK